MEIFECPYEACTETFDTDRGVKIHHSKIHGESIAGEVIECEECGEMFRAPEANERRFCSKKCASTWRSENIRGPECYQYNAVTLTCETCGEAYTVPPSTAKRGSRFCSRKCQSEMQSEEFGGEEWHLTGTTGAAHPKYTGHPGYYGANWAEQRAKSVKRDGYECVICGMTDEAHREEHGCTLHVHHIQPIATFATPEDANTMDNLITLCRPCHARWEGIPVLPEVVGDDGGGGAVRRRGNDW